MLFFVGTFFIVCAETSQAATYYVSNNGTATWTQCTNINTPCPIQTAFNNASAGDIVYFRGGTYNVPAKNAGSTYHGYYEPANSGTATSPITFAAYAGETPLFNGTAGGSADVSDYATIFGTFGRNYIVFDGFKLQSDNGTKMARIHIGSDDQTIRSVGITLKNCDINGGSTPISTQDNRETVRIDSADNILIQKCKLYNARSTDGYQGISGIKSYDSNKVTIENNEVYNAESGVYLKSATDSWIIRNNWLHGNQMSIYITPYVTTAARNATNHQIYNNVIANNTYSGLHIFGETGSNADNLVVYNNTFYGIVPDSICVFITESHGSHFYNNIMQGCPGNQLSYGYAPSDYSIAESDYNNFGSYSFQVIAKVYNPSDVFGSLAEWKTSGELIGGLNPDTHSIASNPNFTNGSGLLTQLTDFALASNSPSRGTGKGGTNMGADVTTVGTGGSTKTIQPPTNLRVQ